MDVRCIMTMAFPVQTGNTWLQNLVPLFTVFPVSIHNWVKANIRVKHVAVVTRSSWNDTRITSERWDGSDVTGIKIRFYFNFNFQFRIRHWKGLKESKGIGIECSIWGCIGPCSCLFTGLRHKQTTRDSNKEAGGLPLYRQTGQTVWNIQIYGFQRDDKKNAKWMSEGWTEHGLV